MTRTILGLSLQIAVAALLAGPTAASTGSETSGAAAASAAASAASPTASAPGAASMVSAVASPAPECPTPEAVFRRVREAARLNAAEANVIEGGAASQAGEVVSNLLGFRGLFSAASGAAELSAHKKIADAMAADPCGDRALEAFPKSYRALYEAYQRQRKK